MTVPFLEHYRWCGRLFRDSKEYLTGYWLERDCPYNVRRAFYAQPFKKWFFNILKMAVNPTPETFISDVWYGRWIVANMTSLQWTNICCKRSVKLLDRNVVPREVRYKIVFWGVKSCSLVEMYQPFWGHWNPLPSRWRQTVLLKRWYKSARLHGATFKKTLFCTFTSARTSNLVKKRVRSPNVEFLSTQIMIIKFHLCPFHSVSSSFFCVLYLPF